jgi:hypothetical protein
MSDGQGIRLSITECLRAIEERLGRAAAIAKAGLACAESGHEQEALRIVMDLEQLTGEADTLFGAAALIGRMEPARQ